MVSVSPLCFFIKQRLSLAIGSLGMGNATEETVTSVVLGTRDVKRSHQEKTEDDERKYPLQSDDLNGKLTQCKGQSEETKAVTQDIILSSNNMEQTYGSKYPNKDIGNDSTG